MRKILTLGIVLALTLALAAPAFAQTTVVHVVQRGENLFRIALRYGVTVNALAAANGLSNTSHIYVGQRLTIPTGGSPGPTPPSSGVHVVRPGENLFSIALRYGITSQALAAANGIANPNRIYVGQRLVIPGSGTTPPTPRRAKPIPCGAATHSRPSPGDSASRRGRWRKPTASATHRSSTSGRCCAYPAAEAPPHPLHPLARSVAAGLT